VSRALAERYWPGQDPIGKRLKCGIAASRSPWQTVVGVAGDVVDGNHDRVSIRVSANTKAHPDSARAASQDQCGQNL
jgi:hypothetical protein